MRKIFLISFVIFLLSLFLISCENTSNPTKPKNESNDLLYLRYGNEWVYSDSLFENGKITTNEISYKLTKINSVMIGTKEYKYFTLSILDKQKHQIGRVFLSNELDGLYNYGSKDEPPNNSFRNILYKYPVDVNSSWKTTRHYFNDVIYNYINDTITIKCVSVKEPYYILKDTINCIKYQYNMKDEVRVEEYWKPGNGLIAYIKYQKDSVVHKRVLKDKYLIKD